MRAVQEKVTLPKPFGRDPGSLSATLSSILKVVSEVLTAFGFRLNRVLPKDGSEVMSGPLPLQSVETADLPAAADHEGAIVYVSDGASGSRFQGSDGTNWISLG